MFIRIMRAERLKLRRSPVWLAFLILPMFPAFFGSVNLLNNLGLLQLDWTHLWTQHSLFSSYFFYPALTGVYCSYLWRLEHFDHNWNQVLSAPVSVTQVFLGKLILAALMTLLAHAWGIILFAIGGLFCGIPLRTFPPEAAMWLLCGVCGGAAVSAFQLLMSLVIRSFAVPVGIAMAGGVLGLGIAAKGFGYFFPYSLLSMGMSANGSDEEFVLPLFFACCAVFILLFSGLAVFYLKKHDVKTG